MGNLPPRKFSLLATLLEMMKYHCLSSLFLTFRTMSHFRTTGKDQIELENVQSLEDRTLVFKIFKFHLH